MAADSINYQVRPNKNVERKLFIEMFRRLDHRLNFGEYRYIGMGGLWFADFTLIHRELGLTDLISIEMRQPQRAQFNRPFECVQVEPGETSSVLPRLDLGSRPAIIWLDYDSDLSGPALRDIATLTNEAATSSICIVTVQADVRQVDKQKSPEGEDFSRLEALEYYAGDFVPLGLKNAEITRSSFTSLVSNILLNAFTHGVTTTGRGVKFQQLLNIAYKDGTTMVTVGGLLYDAADEPIPLNQRGQMPFWPPSTEPFWIRVPLLTVREKAALDQLMPASQPPTAEFIHEKLGFELSNKKLAAYHTFYRQYPMFAEYEF